MVQAHIAVHPKRIELPFFQRVCQATIDWPGDGWWAVIAVGFEKDVFIAFQKGSIPFDDLAKPFVDMFAC